MNQVHCQRYSSTKRLPLKVERPLPLPVFTQRERVDWILTAVQNVCFKLERCLDNQNQKIKNIETNFSQALIDKFDEVIQSNQALMKKMERHHLTNNLKIKPQNTFLHRIRKSSPVRNDLVAGIQNQRPNTGQIDPTSLPALREKSLSQQEKNKQDKQDKQLDRTQELVKEDQPQVIQQQPSEREPEVRITLPSQIQQDLPMKSIISSRTQLNAPTKSIIRSPMLEMDSPFPQRSRKPEPSSIPTIIVHESQQLVRTDSRQNKQESLMQPMLVPETTIVIDKPIFNREEFMAELMVKMRDFHNSLAQKLYNEYSSRKMAYRDMKVQYSWSAMNFYFDIHNQIIRGPSELLQTLGSRMSISKTIDQTTRNILDFLIRKYPPSRNKIVDTQLANHIKQFSRQSDLTYDILRNAGMSFADDTGNRTFTKQIKVWLNMLIGHTKVMFPEFKKIIKGIFIDGDNGSIEGDEQAGVEYQIHSKISENTPLYTEEELNMPGLGLKGPELLRILVKWAEELMGYFIRSDQKIIQNKSGFKSTTRGIGISLTLKRKQNLARTLKQIYKDDILPRSTNRQRHMYNMMNELFTMAFEGYKGYEYLDERQLLIAKVSQYFSECASTYTQKMLNNMIAGLNKLRLKYKNQLLESSLDLVTFGVLDIMRCKCVGSRQQVLRIYRQLNERKDFEIIRVKNKLNQSTRDILINFKHRDSFLICEMQLALGDTKDDVNDHFCHNLYEMRRSAFPVLFENANQLVNLDSRTSYFDQTKQIEFRPNPQFDHSKKTICIKDYRVFCIKSHEQQQMIFHSNSAPFCCSYCSSFVNSHTYSIEYLRCYRCMACICPKCLLDRCPDFKPTYLNRHEKVAQLSLFMRSQPYYTGFCNNYDLQQIVTRALNNQSPRVLVNQFDRQGLKTNVFKLVDGKPVPAFSTVEAINTEWVCDSANNWNIIWIPKKTSIFKLNDLKLYKKESFLKQYSEDLLEDILEKAENVVCALEQDAKRALILDLQQNRQTIQRVLIKIQMIKHIKNQNKKTKLNLQLTTKDLNDLSILKLVNRKSQVRNLNLWQNNLTGIPQLKDFSGIQDLNLRQNKIQSIREVQYMTNLQYLDVHKNNLTGKLPQLDLPNLRTLDLSLNQIRDLSSLSQSSLPNLSVFFISHNQLNELPVLVCPALEVYFFSHNRIQNLDNLLMSRTPKLRRLYGFSNWISGDLPELNFPSLEYLLLEDNRLEGFGALSKWKMKSLENIILSNNTISGSLPAFSLPGLKHLDLCQNRISDISHIGECQLPRLEQLDLSNNAVQGQMPSLPFLSLLRLNLSFNKINSVVSLTTSQLPKLQTLILSNNTLTNLSPLNLPHLQFIDLSNNFVTSIEMMSQWRLPHAQVIKLENNYIQGNVPIIFLSSLNELYLDGNDITELICLKERQLIPRLRIISIKNNKSKEIEVGNLEYNVPRSFHRALSGVWRSKIRPAQYTGDD